MPQSNSRISLGPVYQVKNEYSQVRALNSDEWPQVLLSNQSIQQPHHVQTYDNEELPEVDLKGHSVEELAVAANVTVDVIKAAIRMRQQQLLLEKQNYASKLKQAIASHVTVQPTTSTTIRTTQPTTTPRSTTPYVTKRAVSKYRIAGGHKVSDFFELKLQDD